MRNSPLSWLEKRLVEADNEYMRYVDIADTQQISIMEAAGRENLDELIQEVEDIGAHLDKMMPEYEKYSNLLCLATILGCKLTAARYDD